MSRTKVFVAASSRAAQHSVSLWAAGPRITRVVTSIESTWQGEYAVWKVVVL